MQHIDDIRAWHRERCCAMEQRKRIDLKTGSYLRSSLGWRFDLPAEQRKSIAKAVDDLIDCGEKTFKGKAHNLSDTEEFSRFKDFILASIMSRQSWDAIEASALKELTRLAKLLPVWQSFAESIRGFGACSLAVIVGEAGDLSNYADKSKLWKRMGVAVMGDVRQGGLPKNAKAEQWIEHGYNRQRRSKLYVIGDCLIKTNRDGVYRKAYLDRKAYELSRDPEMKPIHAHRRAQRYMEKRLLRDLLQAWKSSSASQTERFTTEMTTTEIRVAA